MFADGKLGVRGNSFPILLLAVVVAASLTSVVTALECSDDLEICNLHETFVKSSSVYLPGMPVNTAIEGFRVRNVLFIGESTVRNVFSATLRIAQGEGGYVADEPFHEDRVERVGLGRAMFKWAPFAANVTHALSEKKWSSLRSKIDVVVVSVGLHDLRYNEKKMESDFSSLVTTFSQLHNPDAIPFVFLTPPQIKDDYLNEAKRKNKKFRDANARSLTIFMEQASSNLITAKPWFVFANIRFARDAVFGEDGIHSTLVANTVAEALILDYPTLSPYTGNDITVGFVASFLFLGALLALAVLCEVTIYSSRLAGGMYTSAIDTSSEPDVELAGGAFHLKDRDGDEADSDRRPNGVGGRVSSSSSSTPSSLVRVSGSLGKVLDAYQQNNGRSLAVAVATYFFVLLLFALCDGPLRSSTSILKLHSEDGLYACAAVGFLFAITRLSPVKPEVFTRGSASLQTMNRKQTEEWKGWMMGFFLLYHYFDVKEVYNPIRVMVAAFVFLTGYGNAYFFMKFRDFSLVRVLKVILRINLFVSFVCLVLNKPYILYYICALHTYVFFVVYFTFLPLKFAPESAPPRALSAMCLVASLVLLMLLDYFPWMKEVLFFPLEGILRDGNGNMHEWYFREGLDHYIGWVGMLVAFFLPEWNDLLTIVEGLSFSQKIYRRAQVVAVCFFLAWINYVLWLSNPDRFDYNKHHPYVSYMPILAYIILRNLTSKLRTVNIAPLTYLGTTTLETYIAQCHIWMSDDAKSWLVVFEGYPAVSFAVTSVLMVWVSHVTFEATKKFIVLAAPDKCSIQTAVIRVALGLAAFAACFLVSALLVITEEVIEEEV